MGLTVSVVGATGLVGNALLELLCHDAAIDKVHVMTRRPLTNATLAQHPKVVQHVIDFEQIAKAAWPASTMLFCCLGTTIKAAGSKAAFRRVDFDYVVGAARRARETGASHFSVVSAMGANARSSVFYNRVKGEMEAAVATLGFPRLVIVRPSFLAGERQQSRLGEQIALSVLKKFGNVLLPKKYRSIAAIAVARVMLASAKDGVTGTRVIESDQIQNYSENAI